MTEFEKAFFNHDFHKYKDGVPISLDCREIAEWGITYERTRLLKALKGMYSEVKGKDIAEALEKVIKEETNET